MESFGARLKAERNRLRMTQRQFAEIGGVKRVSQHLYEQDVRVPDLNYLLRLRQHDVDVACLIFGSPAPVAAMQVGSLIPLLVASFRAVEESARDEQGELLPYPDRERFFRFLCVTLLSQESSGDMSDLKKHLTNFMRA